MTSPAPADAPTPPPTWRRHPLDRDILRLALPALGALVAEPLYLLTDTAIVGHLGTDALAGMAAATSVLLVGYSIFIFLAYGTTAAVARLLGAGDEREAAHQAVQGMWLAFLIGLVLVVVGIPAAPTLIGWIGATGAVAENAVVYLRISLLGVPALLVTLAGTGYLRGLQDTKTPLIVAVASAALNLVLELALIYGLGLGIAASAAATVVAQMGAAAVYLWWVRRAVRAHDVRLAPHWTSIGGLARVGRDLFFRTVALRSSLTLATAVAAREGPVALASYQIAFELWNFLALSLDAIAIAGQSMIGRFLGASDEHQARVAGRRMIEWGVAAGVVSGLVVAALHGVLPSIFTDDLAVRATAATLLLVVAALQPVNAVVFVLDGLLIGAGDLGYLAIAMVISLAVFAPAAIAVLVTGAGVTWLWGAIALLMLTRLATLAFRWRGPAWAVTGATR